MSTPSGRVGCVIIGSGNIGTDLMVKILRASGVLDLKLIIGIDPASEGLARARAMGVEATAAGFDGVLADGAVLRDVRLVFDATSAAAHRSHAAGLAALGITAIDLTPAGIGPYVIPSVNLDECARQPNVNMITCGGQAAIPVVHAISRVAEVAYAEMISSIASRSAGPGTRQNIDEFTRTTARGIELLGGARRGKAIIILNPAEPPIVMRNTVYALVEEVDSDESAIAESIARMVEDVRRYVPGYRLKAEPLFERLASSPILIPGYGSFGGLKVTVLLEVEGAAHYLPAYAGNLDIMTAAAVRVGEAFAARIAEGGDGR